MQSKRRCTVDKQVSICRAYVLEYLAIISSHIAQIPSWKIITSGAVNVMYIAATVYCAASCSAATLDYEAAPVGE